MDDKYSNVACPRCKETVTVRRKLMTSPFADQQLGGSPEHLSIFVASKDHPRNWFANGQFINGFFCDDCGHGFVTRELLAEVGLDESAILGSRPFTGWRDVWYRD